MKKNRMVFIEEDFTPEAWAAIQDQYSEKIIRLVAEFDAQDGGYRTVPMDDVYVTIEG